MERILHGKERVEIIDSSLHGLGVKSKGFIQQNEIIFIEKPTLFLQSIPNRQDVIICASCARYVGTCGTQLLLLTREISRHEYVHDTPTFPGDIKLASIVPCFHQCGEVYCSEFCRTNHYENGHSLLCTGKISETDAEHHPLIQFKQHAVRTNEIFLLVADLFAKFCAFLDRTGDISVAISSILGPFETFQRNLWWDVAVAPPHEQEHLRHTLHQLVTESWELLNRTLGLEERGVSAILSAEYLARTIGMFEQNNVGVRLQNPIPFYLLSPQYVNTLSPEISDDLLGHLVESSQKIISVIEELGEEACIVTGEDEWEDISDDEDEEEEEDDNINQKPAELSDINMPSAKLQSLKEIISSTGEDNLFPPLDGTSFYTTICRINHSCVPNVMVRYTVDPGAGLCAEMIALRDIQENEELVQSYIDNTLRTEERQALLKDYGFVCTCSLCQKKDVDQQENSFQYCSPCV